MKFDASKTRPILIAESLEEQIISMKLKPGERIYEVKIAKEFGVSQSPVREDLRVLEK